MKKVKKQATVCDLLVRMKAILQKRGWVKGYYAKTKSGRQCGVDSPRAVGYCVTGARLKAAGELDASFEVVFKAARLLKNCVLGAETVEAFNDAASTKKRDVIALINCGIEKTQRTKSNEVS